MFWGGLTRNLRGPGTILEGPDSVLGGPGPPRTPPSYVPVVPQEVWQISQLNFLNSCIAVYLLSIHWWPKLFIQTWHWYELLYTIRCLIKDFLSYTILPQSVHNTWQLFSWYLRCRLFLYLAPQFLHFSSSIRPISKSSLNFWADCFFSWYVRCLLFLYFAPQFLHFGSSIRPISESSLYFWADCFQSCGFWNLLSKGTYKLKN